MPSSDRDGPIHSTTDDYTSTPDASTLDPAMLDEVEQALNAAQGGGVAHPNGGIPQAESPTPTGGVADPNGGIPHAETTMPSGGIARPVGGIPHAESVRPGASGYLDSDDEPGRTTDRRPADYDG